MRTWNGIIVSLLCGLTPAAIFAQDAAVCTLTNAQARDVKDVVELKKAGPSRYRSAHVGDSMKGDDVMRTGRGGSMAELQFDNGSVARLGSETAFTFTGNSNGLQLAKGIALFSAREGCEVGCETCGLTIVQRSTGIVEQFHVKGPGGKGERCATKYILLEGSSVVRKPGGGKTVQMRGGQMILQYADDPDLARVQEVDLRRLVKESRIITGFKNPLPSMPKIQAVVDRQQRELARGTLEQTGRVIGGRGPEPYYQPGLSLAGQEAPFDPDVGRGIVQVFTVNCPTCP